MSTVGQPTAFDILGVTSAASDKELKKAYRRRLRETHPDLNGSAAEFNAVQQAWEKVSTPQKRIQYENMLFHSRAFSPEVTNSRPSSTGATYATPAAQEERRREEFYRSVHNLNDMIDRIRKKEEYARKMAEADREFQRQRDFQRVHEYKTSYVRENDVKTPSNPSPAKTWGMFTFTDEGIIVAAPKALRNGNLASALAFKVMTLVGLSVFMLGGLIGAVTFGTAIMIALVPTVSLFFGYWNLPGLRSTTTHRVIGAVGLSFTYCMVTLLAILIHR